MDNLKGVGELLDDLLIGLGDNDRVVHKCAATESAEDDDIRAIVSRSAHNGPGALHVEVIEPARGDIKLATRLLVVLIVGTRTEVGSRTSDYVHREAFFYRELDVVIDLEDEDTGNINDVIVMRSGLIAMGIVEKFFISGTMRQG